ncbi:unnamed protein product [Phaedon cochleariae]|uniref:Nucleoporin p58/p45 n=1 Tax=Phaedon cochleariae TaxID=80249 RepID=A0A9P0GUN3_PHACE|nr:unnamed protein product [Phaedon cochleariae]
MQNQTNFGFGANPTTQATPGGFQFGAPTQNTSTAPSLFGSQPGAPGVFKPTTGFGSIATQPTSAAPASTGGFFGSTPAQPAATSTLGLFNTTSATTAAPSLFGPATSASTLGSGTTPAVASTGLSFNLGAAATTSTPGFGFGLGAATSSAPTSAAPSFGFGQGGTLAPSTTPASVGFSLGGPTATTASSFSLGLGGSTASAVAAASVAPSIVGLGGVATTQAKAVSAAKDVCPKEQPLPNELLQTVDAFKEMVKQQKLHSSDIARCSVRDFRKVESEIDTLTKLLTDVESQLQKNRHLAEKLKYDTAKCLQSVEIAQRTQDTPPGLQYENTAPLKYFLDLADKFEAEMQSLKVQIESADNYVKNYRSPNTLTPQDLTLGIRRLHETFVALAGRLHSVHSQVESQKESYLNIRRQAYNDNSNPFEKLYKPQDIIMNNLKNSLVFSPPKVASGPTPFSNLALGNSNAILLQQSQTASSFSSSGAAGGFGSAAKAPDTSLFGNSSFVQNSSGFMLQKPPTGTKRGKQ